MKPHPFLMTLLFFLAFPTWAADPPAGARVSSATLENCYDLALVQSETLKSLREEMARSQAQARAALGGAFPRVSWDWRKTWQDGNDSGGDGFGGLLDNTLQESKFTLDQPLFRGLREFSAYSGFKRQEARDAWRVRQAELQLFEEVSQVYFDVLSLETAAANNEVSLSLAQDRVTELKSFLRLGKSREGELASAESQLAAFRAIRVRLQGRNRVARETLSYLVGRDMESVPLSDAPDHPSPTPVDGYVSQAVRRPDVEAQRQEVLAQELRVRYEKGFYWPTANLTGNYYTQRPAFYEPIDWDLMLNLNVPLYQGGTVAARVNDARAALQQAQLELDRLDRRLRSEVKRAYALWTASLDESQALEEAYRAAKKSFEAQRREYRLGLVTNLDVLNAMNLMQADKRAWDEADVESKRRYVALVVATGRLP